MGYTFKQPEKKSVMQKVKYHYKKFMKNVKKGLLTAAGVITGLMALFSGHIFTFVVVGALTYFFWKTPDGVDQLIGKEKVASEL